jgi:hypothetical protein
MDLVHLCPQKKKHLMAAYFSFVCFVILFVPQG